MLRYARQRPRIALRRNVTHCTALLCPRLALPRPALLRTARHRSALPGRVPWFALHRSALVYSGQRCTGQDHNSLDWLALRRITPLGIALSHSVWAHFSHKASRIT